MKQAATIGQSHSRPTDSMQRAAIRLPAALAMASMLSALAFVTPPPLFPAMAPDLGVSVPLLGQVMTAMLFAGAVLSLFVGPLADRHGLRRLLLLGAFAAVGSLLGFGLAPTYSVLLLTSILGGLANATLPGLSLAVARNTLDGPARQRAIGWTTAGGAVAAVAGVPIMAVIGSVAGWRFAFIGGGVAALAMTSFLASALPANTSQRRESAGPRALLGAYAPLVRHRPTLRIYGVTVLRSVCWFGMVGYFGAFMADELGLGAAHIGVAYMLGGSGYVTGSLLTDRMLKRTSTRFLISASNIVLAASVGLMFGMAQHPGAAMALMVVNGFVGAFSQIGTVTLLASETPGGAGTVMVLNGALTNLGAAGGGALGGFLLASGGYEALSLGLPLFALATLPLMGQAKQRKVGQPSLVPCN